MRNHMVWISMMVIVAMMNLMVGCAAHQQTVRSNQNEPVDGDQDVETETDGDQDVETEAEVDGDQDIALVPVAGPVDLTPKWVNNVNVDNDVTISPKSELNDGEIAGIVIGTVLGTGLIVILGLWAGGVFDDKSDDQTVEYGNERWTPQGGVTF